MRLQSPARSALRGALLCLLALLGAQSARAVSLKSVVAIQDMPRMTGPYLISLANQTWVFNTSFTSKAFAPSCTYSSVTGICSPTHAYILGNDARINWKPVGYAARAAIWKLAAKTYCGRFDRNDSDACSYPCADNGETCSLAGQVSYGIYACRESLALADAFCSVAMSADPSGDLCKSTPKCIYDNATNTCSPEFKANLTYSEKMAYLNSWGTTRKSVWGCCLGSEARYDAGVYCTQLGSHEEECNALPGCSFRELDGACIQDPYDWLDTQFSVTANALDISRLKNITAQCDAATTEKECAAVGSIQINHDKIEQVLRVDLMTLFNTPTSNCRVWN